MHIRSRIVLMVLFVSLSLIGCGSDGNGVATPDFVIFITLGAHSGNFLDDPVLTGATSIERADDFCNNDSHKPDNGTYKALLIDDNNRIAIPPTDWVLQPDTTYFRPDGTPIGTTTPDAIFNVAFQQLDNPVGEGEWVHTGIYSLYDFSSNGYNCNNWSSNASPLTSQGISSAVDGAAFNASLTFVGCTCADLRHIYCVKQP